MDSDADSGQDRSWLKRQMQVNNPAIRIAARLASAASPYPLDKLLGVVDDLRRKDVEARFDRLEQELASLGEEVSEKIGARYLESDEFRALFELTQREVIRCTENRKIRTFAMFLKNSVVKGHYSGIREVVLEHISRLSMAHLIMLRAVQDSSGGSGRNRFAPVYRTAEAFGLTTGEVHVLTIDLEGRRLIEAQKGITGEMPDGRRSTDTVSMTPLGKQVLDLISESDPATSPPLA
jgi:hypothetical protein